LDGKLLSEFGKDHVIHEVELNKGYHDIVVIGAVTQSPSVNVNWRPPGETKLVPLPDATLFHDPAATSPPKMSDFHAIPVANAVTPPAIDAGTRVPPASAPIAPAQQPLDLPKSPQAIAALTREEAAVKHAYDVYHQSALASVQACVKDLDIALKLATQSGNLDEANRIVGAKKLVMSNLDQLNGLPKAEGLPSQADLPKSLHAKDALKRDELGAKRATEALNLAVTTAKRQCVRDLDAAIKTTTTAGDLDEANRILTVKKQKEADLDAHGATVAVPTRSSHQSGPAYYACVLGRYYTGQDWKKPHPYINLSLPAENLWSEPVKSQLRGKIVFEDISWRAFAQLVIPHDGIYRIEGKSCWMNLNGKQVRDKQVDPENIELKRGVYEVELHSGTHGQPYLDHATLRIIDSKTQAWIPFVNTEADIKAFMATGVGGQPVKEVSGWKLGPENLVVIKK
jgi:hypothetical protein